MARNGGEIPSPPRRPWFGSASTRRPWVLVRSIMGQAKRPLQARIPAPRRESLRCVKQAAERRRKRGRRKEPAALHIRCLAKRSVRGGDLGAKTGFGAD